MELSVKRLTAGGVGNVLEWYDFGLYGFYAPIIATLFFPSKDRLASLIGAYGVFAIGFAMRPLGGVVLGHVGDRLGRRLVLIVSVTLMGVSTALIGFLPTYETVGIWAPLLLVLIRLLQGFSVGGEFSGSVTYLVETAPSRLRGFAGSFANFGSIVGTLLGSGAAALTETVASPQTLHLWVWRVPFILGGVLAALAYLLRQGLKARGYKSVEDESSEKQTWPIVEAFTSSRRQSILGTLFASGYGIVFYLTLVYLPTYAAEQTALSNGRALQINTIGLALSLLVIPLSGLISDRILRRRTVVVGSFAITVFAAWPLFALILGNWHGQSGLSVAQILFAVLQALVMGSAPAMLVELFPAQHRLSGYSTAYNLGLGIAGGTAPLIATSLIAVSGQAIAPVWYLMFAAALSAVTAYMMKDRSRDPLR